MLRWLSKFLTLGGPFGSYHAAQAAEQEKILKDHERMAKQARIEVAINPPKLTPERHEERLAAARKLFENAAPATLEDLTSPMRDIGNGNTIRNIGPGVRMNAGEITDPTLEPRKDFFRTPRGDIYKHVARHAFSNEVPPIGERTVAKSPLLGAYYERVNPLVEMYDDNHARFFWDLLDLLGKREITLYGLSLAPRDIKALRHNLRRLGYDPKQMQKIVTEPKR